MKLKKIVSLILAVSMMLSVLSSSAFAQSNDNTQIIDLTSEPADEMKPTPTPTGSEPEPTSETQPTPTPEPTNAAQPTPSPEPTEPGSGTQPSPTPTAPAGTEEDAPKPASLPQAIGDDEGIMPVYNGDVQDGVFTVAVDGIDMTFEILTEPSEGVNGTVQFGDNSGFNTAIPNDTVGTVNIPQTVEWNSNTYDVVDISYSAFMNCNEVKAVTIPRTVTVLDGSKLAPVLQNCTNIENINVDNDNPNFSSEDGVLYNKDKSELILYPGNKEGKDYTIPNSVTEIGSRAFFDANIDVLELPANITNISSDAFQEAYSIQYFIAKCNYNQEGMSDFVSYNWLPIYYFSETTGWENIPNASRLAETVFEYNVINGEAELTSAEGIGDVVIPDYTDDGYPITSIGWNAFEWEDNFSSVTIGNNVTTLDSYSFGNTNIPTLILGNSVSEISEDALSSNFTSIVVPEGNLHYCTDEAGILFDKNKTKLIFTPNGLFLEEYTVPDSVLTIGRNAFGTASINTVIIGENISTIDIMAFNMARVNDFNISQNNLNYASLGGVLTNKEETEIIIYPRGRTDDQYEIPEGITNLNAWAFTNNDDLTSIVIGKDVNSISHEGYDSLILPFNLKEIRVDLENTYFSSEDGILFNKDKTEIISYPPAKQGESYAVPDTVSIVGNGAFDGTQYLKNLTISNKVEKINIADSMSSSSVESITFGTGLMEIFQENAIYIMSNLTSVHFKGNYSSNFEDFFNYFPSLTVTNVASAIGWENKGESWPKTEGNWEFGINNGKVAIVNYIGTESDVTVPDNISNMEVETINGYAFSSAMNVNTINIGSNVKLLNEYAFSNVFNLTDINVSENNTNYASVDGVLLNKDKDTLLIYPQAKTETSYTVPESVTTISRDVFYGHNLGTVNFHEDVTTVMPQSQLSWSFSHFYFEGNYNEDGMKEFVNNNIRTIYYANTATGWENVPNAQPIPENEFEYEIINGSVKITGFSGIGEVVIPDTIEDLPVTMIGEWAFSNNSSIESIVIGDNVQSIGNYAFSSTSSLKLIVFGDKVEVIDHNAFNNMYGLTTVEVKSENPHFSSENGVLFNEDFTELILYPSNKTQEEYIIPNSVTKLGFLSIGATIGTLVIGENVIDIDSAFNFSSIDNIVVSDGNPNYSSIDGVLTNKGKTELIFYAGSSSNTEYTVPEGIEVIDREAFQNAHSLTSIVFGKDVREISDEMYGYLILPHILSEISVDPENMYFSGVDGVLYNKDKTELIHYPRAKVDENYIMPETVTIVKHSALSDTQFLRNLTISDKVETISVINSIYGSSVSTITFGVGLKEIEQYPNSYNMPNLTSVHFEGNYSASFEHLFSGLPSLAVTYDDGAVGWENKGESWPKTEGDFEYALYDGDKITITGYIGNAGVINVPDTISGLEVTALSSTWLNAGHNITEINIGKSVESININAFNTPWRLININVAAENSVFSSDSGVLLNKSGTKLLSVPNGRTSIYTVPNGVEIIGANAFASGNSTPYIVITENVKTIDKDAIKNSWNLSNVVFDVNYSQGLQDGIRGLLNLEPRCNLYYTADSTGWENIDGIFPLSQNTFEYEQVGDALKLTRYIGLDNEVVIPDEIDGISVTNIDPDTFKNCTWVTSIEIGNNIEEISDILFSYCYLIEYINIGDAVTSIGSEAFSFKDKLLEINVSGNNPVFSSQDGVLFNKNGTQLIRVPEGRTGNYEIPKSVKTINTFAVFSTELEILEIPDSVTEIAYQAIMWNEKLNSVDFGRGVRTIGEFGFVGNTVLELVIPSQIESIGTDAFGECYKLERVYFEGNYTSNIKSGVESVRAVAQIYYNPSATGWDAAPGAIPLEEYQYEETGETVKIVKYLGFDREVVVPSEINGKAVTAVEDGTFSNCINIDSLILPNSITQINGNFFGESTYGGELFIPLSNTYLKTYFDSISVPYIYLTEVVPETEGTATEELKPEIPQEDISNIFTNEEIEASEETSIAVKLTVDKMEESAVPAEETAAIEAKIQEYQETLIEETVVVAEIIDITLTKTVGSTETDITELNKPIKITIDIPEEHKASNRTYVIVRVHEGVAEILEDLDDNPDTITFETGKFSTYGIAYSEGDYIPGDINGDGAVNNKDVTRLFQHVSNWDVEVNEGACDVNGDGLVNNKDVTRLFQYVSNWDVEIF